MHRRPAGWRAARLADDDDDAGARRWGSTPPATAPPPREPHPTTPPPPAAAATALPLAAACAAILLSSAGRTVFSVCLLEIQAALHITPVHLSSLLNAFTLGYAATALPGGALADAFGGGRVLRAALLLYSLATAGLPAAVDSRRPFAATLLLRFLYGALSGIALPAATALISSLPPARRSAGVAAVFASNNLGSALGLLCGGLVPRLGWRALFFLVGIAGVAVALAAAACLPPDGARAGKARGAALRYVASRGETYGQLALLTWVHSVLNCAFFMFQNWLPTYLSNQLGLNISSSATLSALPWGVMAGCTVLAGRAATAMQRHGWPVLRIRQLMLSLSCMLPAACLLALCLVDSAAPATALLVLALSTHALSTNGYHGHIQDVAPSASGRLLGFTNTVGMGASMLFNVATGSLVEATSSFSTVFMLTAVLYASATILFVRFARGSPLLELA
ncbi:hypothetical protein AB1Y20_022114 [Prymnesium parvum]|uniref:Major facilitator superfamily (MFS) profile domain-containing protein n=1 Tax=Prymnesium parvum TaxID=97485 RepID=A0AB34JHU9_PRYPA